MVSDVVNLHPYTSAEGTIAWKLWNTRLETEEIDFALAECVEDACNEVEPAGDAPVLATVAATLDRWGPGGIGWAAGGCGQSVDTAMVGPAGLCSPRHQGKFNSRNEGLKCTR